MDIFLSLEILTLCDYLLITFTQKKLSLYANIQKKGRQPASLKKFVKPESYLIVTFLIKVELIVFILKI